MEKVLHLKTSIEKILNDNKAIDVKSICLKDKTTIADYMIIASGTSSRHLQALAEMTIEKFKLGIRTMIDVQYQRGWDH